MTLLDSESQPLGCTNWSESSAADILTFERHTAARVYSTAAVSATVSVMSALSARDLTLLSRVMELEVRIFHLVDRCRSGIHNRIGSTWREP